MNTTETDFQVNTEHTAAVGVLAVRLYRSTAVVSTFLFFLFSKYLTERVAEMVARRRR